MHHSFHAMAILSSFFVPFGVTYEKIGTIQRRLAWPLHKDDTLSRSGRSTDLNIYFAFLFFFGTSALQPTAALHSLGFDELNENEASRLGSLSQISSESSTEV
jgi:hypothetical protein